MSWWQKLLGFIRGLLNSAHDVGVIPSQNNTIPVEKQKEIKK